MLHDRSRVLCSQQRRVIQRCGKLIVPAALHRPVSGVRRGGLLFYSDDGGKTWESQAVESPNQSGSRNLEWCLCLMAS